MLIVLISEVFSLASFLSLAPFSEGRPSGSDRERKVYLTLGLFELNNVPRTPADSLSHLGAKKNIHLELSRALNVSFLISILALGAQNEN